MSANRNLLVSTGGFTLICVWSGILFLLNNMDRFYWLNFSMQVWIVIALSVSLWLAGICFSVSPRLVSAQWPAARILSTLTIGVYAIFSHEAARYFLAYEFGVTGVSSGMLYLLAVVVGLAGVWRMSDLESSKVAILVASILLIFLSIDSLIPSALARLHWKDITLTVEPIAKNPGRVLSGENVYYIILDAYGGPAAVEKYLDHELSPFISEMSDLGYSYIDSARANYTVTYASLAATLNMDYIANEASPRYLNRGNFFPSVMNRGTLPRVVKTMTAKNYRFIHVGNGWAPCNARREIVCIDDRDRDHLFPDTLARFFAPTRLIEYAERLINNGASSVVEYDALTTLSNAIPKLSPPNQPSFVFVHHLLPHEPLREDCSRSLSALSKDGYINAIKCLNRTVKLLAHRIQKLDPTAIVVFQGDHGSGFGGDWHGPLSEWTDGAIDERSSILNLMYLPEPCRQWIRQDLSPINTMRLVVGCIERRTPDYLDERTYLAAYEISPSFGVVREVSTRIPKGSKIDKSVQRVNQRSVNTN